MLYFSKTVAIMMIGLPGSGKSTYAKLLSEVADLAVISSDEIREKLTGDVNNQDLNDLVFDKLYEKMDGLLSYSGIDHWGPVDIIVDSTALTKEYRERFIEVAKKNNALAVAYFVDTEFNLCWSRNLLRDRVVPEDVMLKMRDELEPPEESEGWDFIILEGDARGDDNILDRFRNFQTEPIDMVDSGESYGLRE